MKIGSKNVTGDARDLGEAEYPIFETWDEVCNHAEYGIGETKGLEILNAQVRTNAMNKRRTDLTKGPTKGALKVMAMNEIVLEIQSGQHASIVGDENGLSNLIDKRCAEIEARMKADAGVPEETVEA